MKKEELIEKCATLEAKVARNIDADTERRTEISEMLGMVSYKNGGFGYTSEPKVKVLTWPQIYFELGKLMRAQRALQYVEDIEQLRLSSQENSINIKEIEMRLKELAPNKL